MGISRPILLLGAAFLPLVAQAQGSSVPDTPSAPRHRIFLPSGADPQVSARPAGQPVTSLTEAIALTYWNNPGLIAQRATLRSTDNRLPIARSAFGPSLSVQAAHGYQRDRQEIQPNQGQRMGNHCFSYSDAARLHSRSFTFCPESGVGGDCLRPRFAAPVRNPDAPRQHRSLYFGSARYRAASCRTGKFVTSATAIYRQPGTL